MSAQLVLVAAIEGAFGVTGEVRVKAFTDTPEAAASYGPLLNEAGAIVLTPRRWRPIKGGLAIRAPEISTREQAEALRNTALYVPRDRLPAPDDEEFYNVDLIGCDVVDGAGRAIGAVIAVHNFGAGDVLEAKAPGAASVFLPFTRACVPTIDLAARRIVADMPEAEE